MGEITGQRITVDKTYAEMEALIAAAGLNPFLWYKITDRGDRGLVFRAGAVDRLESTGIRYMLCPATYRSTRLVDEVETLGYIDENSNTWFGVWYDGLNASLSLGDLVIWNALVWTAGETLSGDSPDTEGSGFTVVPKTSFSNGEYIEMIFNIQYNFEDDWIFPQWDDKCNKIGLPKDAAADYGITFNPVDCFDWNYGTAVDFFYNNQFFYCTNNVISGDYFNGNTCDYINMSKAGEIYANRIRSIDRVSGWSSIHDNDCSTLYISQAHAIIDGLNISYNKNNGAITGTFDADVTDPIVDKTGTAE